MLPLEELEATGPPGGSLYSDKEWDACSDPSSPALRSNPAGDEATMLDYSKYLNSIVFLSVGAAVAACNTSDTIDPSMAVAAAELGEAEGGDA